MNEHLCTMHVDGIGEFVLSQFLRKGRVFLDVSVTPGKGDPWPLSKEVMELIADAFREAVESVDPTLLSRDQSPEAREAMAEALHEALLRGPERRP